jgi:hypothetical protein
MEDDKENVCPEHLLRQMAATARTAPALDKNNKHGGGGGNGSGRAPLDDITHFFALSSSQVRALLGGG